MDISRARRGDGREALIRAAVAVVASEGLAGFSYRAVARKAGVANTLIVHHFGTRDQLLAEALKWAVTRSLRSAHLNSSASPEFAATIPDAVNEDPDLQVFQYEMMLAARRRPELRPLLAAVYDTYRAEVREDLMKMGLTDVEALAPAVLALVDGLILQQISFASPDDTRRAIAALSLLLQQSQTVPESAD